MLSGMSIAGDRTAEAMPRGDGPLDVLAAALEEANLPTLLLAMAQLSGDRRWVEPPYTPSRARGLGDNDDAGFPVEMQHEIRRSALELVAAWREGRLGPAPPPSPDDVAAMLSTSLAMEVPAEYGAVMSEEMGILGRDVEIDDVPRARAMHVVIVGAGFSGLCLAIKLQQAGIRYTMVEKNTTVGGTWLENTYPGCGVDTPSHLYSFSFFPTHHWSRYFSKRPELHEYLERVTDAFGVRDHIRFGTEVVDARWNDDAAHWAVDVRGADGHKETLEAAVFVSAVGVLNRPSVPPIKGLADFEGPSMHTAAWDPSVELEGKRVAVVGTGASAMQLVPAIAGIPSRLTVFQRSPQWAIPHPNYLREVPVAVRLLMREVPYYAAWYRARLLWNNGDRLQPSLQIDRGWPHLDRSINEENEKHRVFLTRYIEQQLGDRVDDLLDKCLPDYPPYGKRMLLDNGWFAAVTREDVDLVTEDVVEVLPHGIVTASGEEHSADVLVLATGFKTLGMLWPMQVHGRDGVALRDVWGEDDPRAYLGMTVPNFPNFFCLFGPNTLSGHGGSHVFSVELQVRYVMQLLKAMVERDLDAVEVRPEVHDAYNDALDDALAQTVWTHPGMTTYYRNSKGRIVVNIPWKNVEYWRLTHVPDVAEFLLRPGPASPSWSLEASDARAS